MQFRLFMVGCQVLYRKKKGMSDAMPCGVFRYLQFACL